MASNFLDASALVHRYDHAEAGASRVRAICAPSRGHVLMVARLATVEVASAFGRKAREGAYGLRRRDRAWRVFNGHLRYQYRVIDVTDEVYAVAERLVCAHPLRAADAVHIGCAVISARELPDHALQFWTADRRQAGAASAEGLDVRLVS
jgi:predicted nucleic acid-binding protein